MKDAADDHRYGILDQTAFSLAFVMSCIMPPSDWKIGTGRLYHFKKAEDNRNGCFPVGSSLSSISKKCIISQDARIIGAERKRLALILDATIYGAVFQFAVTQADGFETRATESLKTRKAGMEKGSDRMKSFMDQDFLLNTDTAVRLFHNCAEKYPIIDYHCHISPREICEDRRYRNITEAWLGGDHYKWRLMRAAGVPEDYITGNADDHEKFLAWAGVIGRAIGNPLYHWTHLELQRYFGYSGTLNAKTAEEVWNLTNAALSGQDFSVRNLIRRSNVEILCTTDDPADSLVWHENLKNDMSFHTAVLPAWRPDPALCPGKPGYAAYIGKLEKATGIPIRSFADLKKALTDRIDYFHAHGCRLSDHGTDSMPFAPVSEEETGRIFEKGMSGDEITREEADRFTTACLIFLAEQYHSRGWVMQFHFSCLRNGNPVMMKKLGPNTGFDAINNNTAAEQAAALLGELERRGILPKTILYSLNPADDPILDAICGCFQQGGTVCRLQHGSAWWFNDHIDGMTRQLTSLADLGYLPGFVGMLTDSRSFLSYPRHEYFRRILCRLIGEWVEDGRFPNDEEILCGIVRDISYGNAKVFFGFETKE